MCGTLVRVVAVAKPQTLNHTPFSLDPNALSSESKAAARDTAEASRHLAASTTAAAAVQAHLQAHTAALAQARQQLRVLSRELVSACAAASPHMPLHAQARAAAGERGDAGMAEAEGEGGAGAGVDVASGGAEAAAAEDAAWAEEAHAALRGLSLQVEAERKRGERLEEVLRRVEQRLAHKAGVVHAEAAPSSACEECVAGRAAWHAEVGRRLAAAAKAACYAAPAHATSSTTATAAAAHLRAPPPTV